MDRQHFRSQNQDNVSLSTFWSQICRMLLEFISRCGNTRQASDTWSRLHLNLHETVHLWAVSDSERESELLIYWQLVWVLRHAGYSGSCLCVFKRKLHEEFCVTLRKEALTVFPGYVLTLSFVSPAHQHADDGES